MVEGQGKTMKPLTFFNVLALPVIALIFALQIGLNRANKAHLEECRILHARPEQPEAKAMPEPETIVQSGPRVIGIALTVTGAPMADASIIVNYNSDGRTIKNMYFSDHALNVCPQDKLVRNATAAVTRRSGRAMRYLMWCARRGEQ